MKRAKLLQELLMLRFEEAYEGWQEKRFTQEEAARLLGVSDRTFRRYLVDYKEQGLEGLVDARLSQISHRKAAVNEIMEITELYSKKYFGWNVKHFASFYWRMHKGTRGYTWIKTTLQNAGLIKRRRYLVATQYSNRQFFRKTPNLYLAKFFEAKGIQLDLNLNQLKEHDVHTMISPLNRPYCSSYLLFI